MYAIRSYYVHIYVGKRYYAGSDVESDQQQWSTRAVITSYSIHYTKLYDRVINCFYHFSKPVAKLVHIMCEKVPGYLIFAFKMNVNSAFRNSGFPGELFCSS